MPQMGESVAEGTVVRWIKKVGDKVDRDEPLFEISTDKVDAEIPSPVAGVVTEIRVKEGETVPVNSVVAVIGQPSEAPRRPRRTPPPASPPASASQANGHASVGTAAEPPKADHARPAPAPPPPAPGPAADAGRRRQSVKRACVRHARRPHDAGVDGRTAPRAIVTAGAPHRQRARRGHLEAPRNRHRRPRDEGRHPRLHRPRAGRAGGAGRAGEAGAEGRSRRSGSGPPR